MAKSTFQIIYYISDIYTAMTTYKHYEGVLTHKTIVVWCLKYKRKLEKSIDIHQKEACHPWTGAVTYSKHDKLSKYGRFRMTSLITKQHYETSAHRAYFMVSNNLPMLEPAEHLHLQYKKDKFEASHLCHHELCMNLEHISYEPKSVNLKRKKCKNKSKCDGHTPFPACMFKINSGER